MSQGASTSQPFNPFAGMFHGPDAQTMWGPWAAWINEVQQAQARFSAAMPKVMAAARKATKGCTPHEVVMTEAPVRLIRYQGKADRRFATPVLFVFALVNRPYVLDLLPHKSVVRRFLDAGFDVYLIDWGVPTPSDGGKTLHDYVEGHLHNAVTRILDLTGSPQVNLVGYCMGGTLSAMYTSLHQDLVRNLILMAAPFDWTPGQTLLSCWTDPRYFNVDALCDAMPLIPPALLGSSFVMLKPVANLFQKWTTFFERMDDEKFLEEFFAMELWTNDNIPICAEVYRDFVKYCFQQNLLRRGEFPLGRRKINLGNITCPVLNLTASADHLVDPVQSHPVRELVSSTDFEAIQVQAGHIGLSVGSKAHKELWPRATAWLADRSEPIEVPAG